MRGTKQAHDGELNEQIRGGESWSRDLLSKLFQ